MELYATGFNAWGQLNLDKQGLGAPNDLPDDLHTFARVFTDDRVTNVWSSLSATIVDSASGTHSAGLVEDWTTPELHRRILSPTLAMTGSGVLAGEFLRPIVSVSKLTSIAYSQGTEAISQYATRDNYLRDKVDKVMNGLRDIIQIVAYEAGFAALSTNGEVWTWGGDQSPACLGRVVEEETSPAHLPGIVADLVDLPTGKVIKIAAGGWVLLALTEGNDLYAWGGHPGLPVVIPGLSQLPAPLVVEDNDVVDFAVGSYHAVMLTQGGELFVIGDNTNGQLGIPLKSVDSWTRVPFDLEPGKHISAVTCGPRNTFVVVRSETDSA